MKEQGAVGRPLWPGIAAAAGVVEGGSKDDVIFKGDGGLIVAQGKLCGGKYLVRLPEATQSEPEVK